MYHVTCLTFTSHKLVPCKASREILFIKGNLEGAEETLKELRQSAIESLAEKLLIPTKDANKIYLHTYNFDIALSPVITFAVEILCNE